MAGSADNSGKSALGADCRALAGMTEVDVQLPRTGGITTSLRRQARRSISSQARNCRSLLMQTLTSLSRRLVQVTAIAELLSPGLTLMKAASMASGLIDFDSDNCRNSSGIFTAARALRMFSK